MDMRDIVDLVNLVSAKDISELEVERDGMRVRIVKAPGAAVAYRSYEAPAAARGSAAVEHVYALPLGNPVAAAPAAPAAAAAAEPAAAGGESDLSVMRSPIVGTFYRASSPSAEPYAKPGDHVKKGQVLCIVEAMKLMNEIESEVSGVVVEVLVEDGQPVEYGEPLFRIRPER